MTPMDLWAGWWRNASALAQTGSRLAETAAASAAVVDVRTGMMRAAMSDPASANYRELSTMVPEKVEAFGQAGRSALADIHALNLDAVAQWQQAIGMMMSGRPPSLADLGRFSDRSMRMATRASAAGGKALAPVHKRATGNARRLAASKKR